MIQGISAITLATSDMARAVGFYTMLGFDLIHGGGDARFSSLRAGSGYLNLTANRDTPPPTGWGRVIFHVSNVDEMHARAVSGGARPDTTPRDAAWGERYFHLTDPDGHQLSFARPLPGR